MAANEGARTSLGKASCKRPRSEPRGRGIVTSASGATVISVMAVCSLRVVRPQYAETAPARAGTDWLALLRGLERLAQFRHGAVGSLDFAMEELGHNVMIGAGYGRRLGVVLRHRADELA